MKPTKKRGVEKFFPVNRAAGKLRLILLLLFLFILWTVIAQSTSLQSSLLFRDHSKSTFTAGLFRDILSQYFGFSTIIFTLIPVTIFLTTCLQTATFLGSIIGKENGFRNSREYLTNCAFSRKLKNITFSNLLKNKYTAIQKSFGGPAQVSFDKTGYLLTKEYRTGIFRLYRCEDDSSQKKIHLAHGERIMTAFPESGLQHKFDMTGEDFDTKETLHCLIHAPFDSSKDVSSHTLNREDAWFLIELSRENNVIEAYLFNMIERFFLITKRKLQKGKGNRYSPVKTQKQKNGHKQHSIYATLPSDRSNFRSESRRKHTLSKYGFLTAKNQESKESRENNELSGKAFIDALNEHVDKEMVSFFGLSDIKVRLSRKGK